MGLDMMLYDRNPKADPNDWPTDIMYWRKANEVYGWVLERYPAAYDDVVTVTRGDLIELRDLCADVLDHRDDPEGGEGYAREYLPPREGFFFGTYEIDEWYYEDLTNTVEGLNRVLDEHPDRETFWFYASW